ncbi:MAG: SIMPL domain-containing protein [Christensenellaceae bacterium]|nr:SIMPL domain-containing protein [Christensenellaceae bacterium]
MNDAIISVKGLGEISLKPDVIVIKMHVIAINLDYAKMNSDAAISISHLKQCFSGIGFNKKCLKTINFRITSEYERIKNTSSEWEDRFIGYKCQHDLVLEFEYDINKLEEVINAISESGVKPKYDIKFSVKNQKQIKKKLINSAVNDAKNKAQIIASAAGVKLGDIVNINYSEEVLNLFSPTTYDNSLRGARLMSEASIDINPQEIQARDYIIIQWAIINS